MTKKYYLQKLLNKVGLTVPFEYAGKSYEKILILGNGPSLNLINGNELKKFDCVIVSNHFYATSCAQFIKPDFYCVSDPRLFFPPDRQWVQNARATNPEYFVVPMTAFGLSLGFGMKCLYYLYDDRKKLWEKATVPKFDLRRDAIPTGDSVLVDVMIPLAISLGGKEIAFCGVDLKHNHTVSHAYDEKMVGSKRRSDNYLMNEWPGYVTESLTKQVREIKSRKIVMNPLYSEQKVLTAIINEHAR